jgi:hypothetical protein
VCQALGRSALLEVAGIVTPRRFLEHFQLVAELDELAQM